MSSGKRGGMKPALTLLSMAAVLATAATGAQAQTALSSGGAPSPGNYSIQNASLFGAAQSAVTENFVQNAMRCDSFGVNGFCTSAGLTYLNNVGQADGHNYQGEFNLAYRITPNWSVGFGYQGPNYHLNVNGANVSSDDNTFGLFVEYGNRLRQGVFARAAIAYQQGNATIGRSYPVGSETGYSVGTAGIGQKEISTQAGYVFIVQNNVAIMPYAGIDYQHSSIDAYSETGGANPASFSGASQNNLFGTLGVNGSLNLGGRAIVTAGLKHIQRLNSASDPISANISGVGNVTAAAATNERWNEATLNLQFEGPARGSRINLQYGHTFGSSPGVPRDIASVSFAMGF